MHLKPKSLNIRSVLKLFTTGDKILVAMLILLAITSLFAINMKRQPGETCSIEVSGELKYHLKLSENRDLLVNGPIGETLIKIKNHKVRVTHSDCPEQICVKTGWIHKTGEFIVCVPNKVVIKIDGEKNDHFNVITQ